MTKTQLIDYLLGCIELAEQKRSDNDGLVYVRPDLLRAAIALIPPDEPTCRHCDAKWIDGTIIQHKRGCPDWPKDYGEMTAVNRGDKHE